MAGCTIRGCHRDHRARGLCSPHYLRQLLYGDPLAGMPVRPRRRNPGDHCPTCEDIEFLISMGNRDMLEIATRTVSTHPVNYRRIEALRVHLRRHSRQDLLDRIEPRLVSA
jgi:hypothetical protein